MIPPPSKSHVWCPNMTNDTSLESSCALLLESAKKFANLQKLNFFIAKSSYIAKMFAKTKFVQKIKKWYIFDKPLTVSFQICKNFCKILNNLNFNQEKQKCANFLWQVVCKKFSIFSQNVCNSFPYFKGFPKS